jgi:Uma2 family endonuclease
MLQRVMRGMTQAEFLAWLPTQERRHELVDGVPVAMAGAKRRHDQIVVNALRELSSQLRRGRCHVFSADTAVLIPAGNVRMPDAGVDCGAFDGDANFAAAPVLVIEVLSASTRDFDLFVKLEEYRTLPGLRHIVMVDPEAPQVVHWARDDAGSWGYTALEGLQAVLSFPDLPATIPLAELYEGLEFRPLPRLILDDGRG